MFMPSASIPSARRFRVLLFAICLGWPSLVHAQQEPPATPPPGWEPTAIDYSNVHYPHPVSYLNVRLMGEDHRMAYMDVAPEGEANGTTVVLFHGMNFFAAAFAPTIAALRDAGFRVIAVDRLGYGRSSKPLIHYNLHIPARNTKALLDALGIERVAIVGHSMGGMVATRFASTYPDVTSHVVMSNQIGLTDTRPGRPWADPEDAYRSVLERTTHASVLAGHRRYYPNGWRDRPGAPRRRRTPQRRVGAVPGDRPRAALRDPRPLSRGADPVPPVGSRRAGGSGLAVRSASNEPAGDRTQDLRIKSPLLYQLSYRLAGKITPPRS